MNKEFIPYQESLALKELGFNEPCFRYWKAEGWIIKEETRTDGYTHADQVCAAPTFSQAFRWFREEYQMVFCYEPCLKKDLTYIFFIYMETTGEKIFVVESKYNKESELACLIKLIEIANKIKYSSSDVPTYYN